MEHLFTVESLISFIILVILEVVLGIDNVIFVSLIINRLKEENRIKARRAWMITGILVRSGLLFALGWLLSQKGKYIIPESWFGKGFDLASIVMLVGGLFLIYKSVKEIHGKLEGEEEKYGGSSAYLSLGKAIFQIMLIDAVFSFDSVITAGGTAKFVEIMIAAVVIAMIVMFLFSPKIASFIHKHPTVKMLALSFLVMIGLSLVIEGWDHESAEKLHLKNYIYFGMAFSFIVEMLNMTMFKKKAERKVVELNEPRLRNNEEGVPDEAH
jgi:predicted tellurium resistance membrane protein TerC